MTATREPFTLDAAGRMLSYVRDGHDRDLWVTLAQVLKDEYGDAAFPAWDEWSAGFDGYKPTHAKTVWKSCKSKGSKKATMGTLVKLAKDGGWTPERRDKHRLSDEEFHARQAERAKRLEAEAAAVAAERATCAAFAKELWDRAKPATAHPYLTKKQVPGTGLRVIDRFEFDYTDRETGEIRKRVVRNALLVPVRQSPSELVGLQYIEPDGGKFFLSGTHKEGGYFAIGKPGSTFVIGEGFATCATVHVATQWPVVIAFDAGNLAAVARKIRARFPEARIIIAGDDDAWTKRKDGTAWNPGREAAEFAASEINGEAFFPVWLTSRPEGHTDFNDLAADEDMGAVNHCFFERAAPPVKASEPAAPSIPERHADDPGPHSIPEYARYSPPGDDDDVFIFTTTPLLTAQAYQDSLPADSKVLYWRDQFYTWNGHRYAVRDKVFVHQQLYRFMATCYTQKKNPKTGDTEVILFSPNRKAVEDVMHALTAVCFVELDEAPCWIKNQVGDWPATEIIAFKNGFLHWPTRRMMPPDPRLFVISTLDFDFEENAPAPVEWLKFLDSVWSHDPESIEALGDMFGYLLTDDTSQQKAFMLIGPPRCGKGTILRVLENLVGMHNRVSPSLAGIGTQFGLQPLIGKRVAMISDARLSGKVDQQAIVENILRITGEDTLTVDRKNIGSWSGKLSTRFILASNETPGFTDASAALANRFVLFKFVTSFLGQEDHGLTGRILRELPGITLWALAGLERLRARGYLIQPKSSRDIADELRETSSPIGEFVQEMCVTNDPTAHVDRDDIFKVWREWCSDQGMEHPGTKARFGKLLSAAVPGLGRNQDRVHGGRANRYTGIRLRNVSDDYERPF